MSEKKTNSEGQTYKEWMKLVDDQIEEYVGMGSGDLSDFLYMDAFLDDAVPDDVAADALDNDSTYGGQWRNFTDIDCI